MYYNDKFDADQQVTLEELIAALIFDWDYQGDETRPSEQEATDMSKEILKLVVEELRPDLVARKWVISDGNAVETYDDWDELINTIKEWYYYLLEETAIEDEEFADAILSRDFENIPEGGIEALNSAIRAWEERIAQAAGYKEFAGHGNYAVSAASEMGLNLTVREDD